MMDIKKFYVTLFALLSLSQLHSQELAYEWGKTFGGDYLDQAHDSAVDKNGNIYVTGEFNWLVDFDPSEEESELFSGGNLDLYIAKFDPEGNLLWAKHNQMDQAIANSICVDTDDNVIVVGEFMGTVDFNLDEAEGEEYIEFSGTVLTRNSFALKVNADGDFQWAKTFTTNFLNIAYHVDSDADNNVYMLGDFIKEIDLDPDPNNELMAIKDPLAPNEFKRDLYLIKLSSDGQLVWGNHIPTTLENTKPYILNDLTVDVNGDVYLCGEFSEGIDFDLGPEVLSYEEEPYKDPILVKYTTDGVFDWSHVYYSDTFDTFYALDSDDDANIYISGHHLEAIDIDQGPEEYWIGEPGNWGFVYKCDMNGDVIWGRSFPTQMFNLKVDKQENVYVAGNYYDAVDIDPGPEEYIIEPVNSAGSHSLFVQKLHPDGSFAWANTFGGTGYASIEGLSVFDEDIFYLFGTYEEQIDLKPGPLVESHTSQGNFDMFLQKFSYCDANEVVLDVPVLPELTSKCEVVPAAPTATNGCGDVFTASCSTSFPITESQQITWVYTAIDTPTIQTQNIEIVPINTDVSTEGTSLIAVEEGPGCSYQWVDCDYNNTIIPGATSQQYSPPHEGNFAVVISYGDCSAQSSCYSVDLTIGETLANGWRMYPNPFEKSIHLDFGKLEKDIHVRLYTTTGQMIAEKQFANTQIVDWEPLLTKGMYILEISVDQGLYFERIQLLKK